MEKKLSGFFRFLTVITWIVFAGLSYIKSEPQVWIPTYLIVSLLYSTEWYSFFHDPGRRILIAGLGKSIGIGYFVWGFYNFLDNPKPDLDSEVFKDSMGLALSSIWLFLLPFFQGRNRR
ncbi:hypothetical protein EHQ81_03235 [Leptospira selangorensis]|uniref:Uncharacterized protein n=1 Tax=Leptospira selangorensis TaxID=2484982 RepID=A0A5F2C248_9LEPT|nr:hypothetical protein [Leptospira selangorensis]TGM15423.1 hypothetical protein EHQ81_03235 [Leptospira selangorensis]TGM18628.1 hypothetical protein EHQ82_16475 [Leptospira selangorensis]